MSKVVYHRRRRNYKIPKINRRLRGKGPVDDWFRNAGNAVANEFTNPDSLMNKGLESVANELKRWEEELGKVFDPNKNGIKEKFDEFAKNVAPAFAMIGDKLRNDLDPRLNGVDAAFRKFGNDVNKAFEELGDKIKKQLDADGEKIKQAFKGLSDTIGNESWWKDTMSNPETYFFIAQAVISCSAAFLGPAGVALANGVVGAARMITKAARGEPILLSDLLDIAVSLIPAGGVAAKTAVKTPTTFLGKVVQTVQTSLTGVVKADPNAKKRAFGEGLVALVQAGETAKIIPPLKPGATKEEDKSEQEAAEARYQEQERKRKAAEAADAAYNPLEGYPNKVDFISYPEGKKIQMDKPIKPSLNAPVKIGNIFIHNFKVYKKGDFVAKMFSNMAASPDWTKDPKARIFECMQDIPEDKIKSTLLAGAPKAGETFESKQTPYWRECTREYADSQPGATLNLDPRTYFADQVEIYKTLVAEEKAEKKRLWDEAERKRKEEEEKARRAKIVQEAPSNAGLVALVKIAFDKSYDFLYKKYDKAGLVVDGKPAPEMFIELSGTITDGTIRGYVELGSAGKSAPNLRSYVSTLLDWQTEASDVDNQILDKIATSLFMQKFQAAYPSPETQAKYTPSFFNMEAVDKVKTEFADKLKNFTAIERTKELEKKIDTDAKAVEATSQAQTAAYNNITNAQKAVLPATEQTAYQQYVTFYNQQTEKEFNYSTGVSSMPDKPLHTEFAAKYFNDTFADATPLSPTAWKSASGGKFKPAEIPLPVREGALYPEQVLRMQNQWINQTLLQLHPEWSLDEILSEAINAVQKEGWNADFTKNSMADYRLQQATPPDIPINPAVEEAFGYVDTSTSLEDPQAPTEDLESMDPGALNEDLYGGARPRRYKRRKIGRR